MDCGKVGQLILSLRKEKDMTQRELADTLNISDRTISKWERGIGCPDVSLLNELSLVLGVNIEKILLGDLSPNRADGGNMKKIKYYVCQECGNVLFSTGDAEISCCGRKLNPLELHKDDLKHQMIIEELENDLYVTFDHEMTKEHYISFVAYVTYDRILFVKLYPEQSPQVRFTKTRKGELYFYCNQHGLMKTIV